MGANNSLKGKPIATAIIAAGKWYDGEDYHQEYREYPHASTRRALADT